MTTALTACVTIATITTPTKAQARCYGCWAGAAVAAGLIGSAIIANRAYGYGYYGGYAPAYGYAPYSYAPYGYGYGYAPYAYAPYGYGYSSYYAPYRGYYGGYYAPRRIYHRGYYAPRRAYVRQHYRR
jgi:hypothetical protein